jgi:hypothetical protein
MIWHQGPHTIMYDILPLTNSTVLTADVILLCTKKDLYPIHDSYSHFHRKMCILPQVRCYCRPIWSPALLPNLIYVWLVPSKLSPGSPTYTNSLHSIIRISNPYSIAWAVYPKNPSRWRVDSHTSTEDRPLPFVRGCLLSIFASRWMLFLHPKPEDSPCCGDRYPLLNLY